METFDPFGLFPSKLTLGVDPFDPLEIHIAQPKETY